ELSRASLSLYIRCQEAASKQDGHQYGHTTEQQQEKPLHDYQLPTSLRSFPKAQHAAANADEVAVGQDSALRDRLVVHDSPAGRAGIFGVVTVAREHDAGVQLLYRGIAK